MTMNKAYLKEKEEKIKIENKLDARENSRGS